VRDANVVPSPSRGESVIANFTYSRRFTNPPTRCITMLKQNSIRSVLEHDPLVANDDVTTKFEEVATSSPPPTFLA
jgi:hypothetical protein